MELIRKRIKEEIEKSGMSQRQIAEAIGVKQPTVSEYVHFQSLPALDTLRNLCKVLDVSADYILGLTDYAGKKNY